MENATTAGSGNKREREEWDEDLPETTKRLREDLFLDILDDDDRTPAAAGEFSGDLADVMKSFEEEIAPAPATESSELGFLLEASDDDLGLPPTAPEASPAPEVDENVGLEQIWGFEDEIPSFYDGFGTEFFGEDERDGDIYGGGLFGDDVAFSWPSDSGWRQESMPAV